MHTIEAITAVINAAVPDAVEETSSFRHEHTVVVNGRHLVAAIRALKEDQALQFVVLSDISADDLLPEFPRYRVNYHLLSLVNKQRLRVQVVVDDPDEGPETLASLWHVATWLEMEVWDLMGIRFAGNGSLRRLFLPEDWQGHPLRKDYPLGYEEVQFSFNWEAIDAKKPYAQD